ncbi:hypothetical protein GCM10023115_25220 [Pontixanthobacter gangjinensis]|uniref:Sulfotransferase n=1 Tax=Christiangramia aestuarii TaxID=1028746 RepID=A0A7M3SYS6_9FLAO|nr:sulfotransferase [Christiangramia aestuarii]MUP41757.1 sulfotransferase [Christiangramia aestuarii]
MKIIFLNSYSPRTGHNFIAQVLKIASNCEVIPHSHAETRLSLFLNSYYDLRKKLNLNKSALKFMDSLFIDNMRETIADSFSADYLLIKDTNQVGVEYLKLVFPNEYHILMFRDPRDTLVSIFKGMRFYHKSGFKNYIKKIGYKTGLYSYYYSKNYSNQFMKTIPKNIEDYYVIKYEDVVRRNNEELGKILEIFNSSITVQDFKNQIDEISVINTSFHKEETGGKGIWDTKKRTEKFNPISRKKIPYLHRKGIELGSKKFRKKLGYIN